jgi:drug/metabolite transporter (DMT)-like permease
MRQGRRRVYEGMTMGPFGSHARRSIRDWLHLTALVVMWGTAFLFTKLAVQTVPPATVVAARLLIAALVLVAVVGLRGLRLRLSDRRWLYFVFVGVVGNCLPFFLISWGQQRIDSGLAGILMAVNPLATLVLAHYVVAGERISRLRAAGFLLGFAGIVVLMGPAALLELSGGDTALVAEAAVLAGALCYAVTSVVARRMPPTQALVAAAGVMVISSAVMVPVALAVDRPWALAASATSAWAIVALGVFATAVPTIVYFRLIASAGPTFLSLINYLIPLMAVATGVVVLDESVGIDALAALALILGGIALTQLGAAERPGV